MKRDPRGPRDFYVPPPGSKLSSPSRSRRATRVLALLYLLSVAVTLLLCFAAVGEVWVEASEAGPLTRALWGLGVSLGLGWLLSFAAFQVRREEGAWGLGVFVLASGLLTGGLVALVSLPFEGGRA